MGALGHRFRVLAIPMMLLPAKSLAPKFACLLLVALLCNTAQAEPVVPGAAWSKVESPEKAGWSSAKLKAAQDYSKTINTEAVFIVAGGRVVDEWGATTKRFNIHSIRKSFVSSLYGIAVDAGQIDLNATLDQLGIDDRAPALTAEEKLATVHDLLKARSGIYHHAAYETASMRAKRPARGSHPHGSFWFYNNWDFNALGTIYKNATKQTVFEAFEEFVAEPIGMEDFRLEDTKFIFDDASDHPAYTFRMTARDMARFGLLYLRGGKWGDRQVVPKSWIADSVKSYSDAGASGGYGYMWWVAAGGKHFPENETPDGVFSARGHGGHYIVCIPQHDLVVVHRVNTDIEGREVPRDQFGKLLKLILDAKR
jgi:CubicO group peptidase (beta-lactamase class C family)